MIKVLLVDDHTLVRAGLRRIIDASEQLQVVGEACTGEQALELIREQRPDVVLMDLLMPGMGGLQATHRINQLDPAIAVIALSVHTDDVYPARVLEAGAQGYLTKDCDADEIITAIVRVHAGEPYLDAGVARNLALARAGGRDGDSFDKLSRREMQVMLLVTQGSSIQEISDQLFLSPKTVNTYRYRLFDKLGVSNDVELTRLAMRHGLLGEARIEE